VPRELGRNLNPTPNGSQNPTQSPVSISETGHNKMPFQNSNKLLTTISAHPRFAISPDLSILITQAYKSAGEETINVTIVFVAYFSELNGRIEFILTA
jgi:hypothetical protein